MKKDRSNFNESFPTTVGLLTPGTIAKTPTYLSTTEDEIEITTTPLHAQNPSTPTTTDTSEPIFWTTPDAQRCPFPCFSSTSSTRRSSSSSITDTIEECPSDEEQEEEVEDEVVFNNCKNCSRTNHSHIGLNSLQQSFCATRCSSCGDKRMSGQMIQQGEPRRSSWTAGDRNELHLFRQTLRMRSGSSSGSGTGSVELPSIREPSGGDFCDSDEEERDIEVQRSVQCEVERLIRFNMSSQGRRRGTIG